MGRREPHRVDPTQTWHDTPAYRRGYRDASGRAMDSSSAGVGGRGPTSGGGGGGKKTGCPLTLLLLPILLPVALLRRRADRGGVGYGTFLKVTAVVCLIVLALLVCGVI